MLSFVSRHVLTVKPFLALKKASFRRDVLKPRTYEDNAKTCAERSRLAPSSLAGSPPLRLPLAYMCWCPVFLRLTSRLTLVATYYDVIYTTTEMMLISSRVSPNMSSSTTISEMSLFCSSSVGKKLEDRWQQ